MEGDLYASSSSKLEVTTSDENIEFNKNNASPIIDNKNNVITRTQNLVVTRTKSKTALVRRKIKKRKPTTKVMSTTTRNYISRKPMNSHHRRRFNRFNFIHNAINGSTVKNPCLGNLNEFLKEPNCTETTTMSAPMIKQKLNKNDKGEFDKMLQFANFNDIIPSNDNTTSHSVDMLHRFYIMHVLKNISTKKLI